MKKIKKISVVMSILALSSIGCQTTTGSYTQKTTLGGASAGAILGTVIGYQSGEGLAGAAVGTLAGGLAGNLYGNAKKSEMAEARSIEEQRHEHEKFMAKMNMEKQELDRKRSIAFGQKIEDPQILKARQETEAAEAEVARVKKEQEIAYRRAKEIEELENRKKAALEELENLNQ